MPSDGEYPVLLGGRNISVYCHDMATNWPRYYTRTRLFLLVYPDSPFHREFLTLPKGEHENYSEVRSYHEVGCSWILEDVDALLWQTPQLVPGTEFPSPPGLRDAPALPQQLPQ